MSIAAEIPAGMLASVAPIWRRIADDLRAGIRSGAYPVGTKLPSIPDLAERYAPPAEPDKPRKPISRVHVQAAMAWLVTSGLVEARTGSGHTVVATETWEERARACERRRSGE